MLALTGRPVRIVATLVAFALFAWVLAQAFLRLTAPTPAAMHAPAPAQPVATILASGLWSGAAAPSAAPVSASAAETFALLGVMAERDGGGYAVVRSRSGARVVAPGGEIVPGVTLVGVDAHQVRVRDGGGERTVELRRVSTPVPPPGKGVASQVVSAPRASAAPTLATRATSAACAAPAGFRGPVLKLHAELVEGLVAQPESWRALLAPEDGALVVRDEGGFATLLGLARGDRLTVANGVALQDTDDLVAAVLKPLIASQPVRIAGLRAGQPREILVLNAGACP